ncbi:MAG: hypothetical protein Q3M24_21510 [Candidatus Electrothrix aestuarii]|uniref:HNH endonuclease n=1 Tax=Candidatus Electrothrix aestuarii TaxID=3062594 RepID=A0AAU8LU91_9BACT|nr:hypothetical protein [Candidatus Electrothrix aestuarii]
MDNNNPCWICGNPSDSREHIFKKSDLVRRYGNVPFKNVGGVSHFKDKRVQNVPGPKSKTLSYDPLVCSNCNNKKSQPWDKAYEVFEKWVFDYSNFIFEVRFIPLELVYGEDELLPQSVNLFKYFVKSFGCRLSYADASVPKDLADLLDKEYFSTKLRLTFSINRVAFAFPEYFEDFLGVGELYRINSRAKGTMERFNWLVNVGWLRIYFFYDHEIPSGVGAGWTADSSCLYLGEIYAPSLEDYEKLIEDAKNNETAEQVDNLTRIKETLWGKTK